MGNTTCCTAQRPKAHNYSAGLPLPVSITHRLQNKLESLFLTAEQIQTLVILAIREQSVLLSAYSDILIPSTNGATTIPSDFPTLPRPAILSTHTYKFILSLLSHASTSFPNILRQDILNLRTLASDHDVSVISEKLNDIDGNYREYERHLGREMSSYTSDESSSLTHEDIVSLIAASLNWSHCTKHERMLSLVTCLASVVLRRQAIYSLQKVYNNNTVSNILEVMEKIQQEEAQQQQQQRQQVTQNTNLNVDSSFSQNSKIQTMSVLKSPSRQRDRSPSQGTSDIQTLILNNDSEDEIDDDNITDDKFVLNTTDKLQTFPNLNSTTSINSEREPEITPTARGRDKGRSRRHMRSRSPSPVSVDVSDVSKANTPTAAASEEIQRARSTSRYLSPPPVARSPSGIRLDSRRLSIASLSQQFFNTHQYTSLTQRSDFDILDKLIINPNNNIVIKNNSNNIQFDDIKTDIPYISVFTKNDQYENNEFPLHTLSLSTFHIHSHSRMLHEQSVRILKEVLKLLLEYTFTFNNDPNIKSTNQSNTTSICYYDEFSQSLHNSIDKELARMLNVALSSSSTFFYSELETTSNLVCLAPNPESALLSLTQGQTVQFTSDALQYMDWTQTPLTVVGWNQHNQKAIHTAQLLVNEQLSKIQLDSSKRRSSVDISNVNSDVSHVNCEGLYVPHVPTLDIHKLHEASHSPRSKRHIEAGCVPSSSTTTTTTSSASAVLAIALPSSQSLYRLTNPHQLTHELNPNSYNDNKVTYYIQQKPQYGRIMMWNPEFAQNNFIDAINLHMDGTDGADSGVSGGGGGVGVNSNLSASSKGKRGDDHNDYVMDKTGRLVLKTREVLSFTQAEISTGLIYYQCDEFLEGPNKSGNQSLDYYDFQDIMKSNNRRMMLNVKEKNHEVVYTLMSKVFTNKRRYIIDSFVYSVVSNTKEIPNNVFKIMVNMH